MHITIKNWKKYQKRTAGYKKCTWFSFAHNFFDDPKVWDLDHSAQILFIYFLCEASKEDSPTFYFSMRKCSVQTKMSEQKILSYIDNLQDLSMICPASDQDLISICPASDQHLITTRQDKTRQDSIGKVAEDWTKVHEVWMFHCDYLHKVKTLNAKRKGMLRQRWGDRPDPDFWENFAKAVAQNKFCNGENDRKWRANFDWFISPAAWLKFDEGTGMWSYQQNKTKPKPAPLPMEFD